MFFLSTRVCCVYAEHRYSGIFPASVNGLNKINIVVILCIGLYSWEDKGYNF